jgi:hypothetical protein
MGPYLVLSISDVSSGTNITSDREAIPFVLNISNLKILTFKPRVPTSFFSNPDKKKKKGEEGFLLSPVANS